MRIRMHSRSMIGDHEDDGAVIPGGLRVPLTVAVHHMMSLVTIIMSFVKRQRLWTFWQQWRCFDYYGYWRLWQPCLTPPHWPSSYFGLKWIIVKKWPYTRKWIIDRIIQHFILMNMKLFNKFSSKSKRCWSILLTRRLRCISQTFQSLFNEMFNDLRQLIMMWIPPQLLR